MILGFRGSMNKYNLFHVILKLLDRWLRINVLLRDFIPNRCVNSKIFVFKLPKLCLPEAIPTDVVSIKRIKFQEWITLIRIHVYTLIIIDHQLIVQQAIDPRCGSILVICVVISNEYWIRLRLREGRGGGRGVVSYPN